MREREASILTRLSGKKNAKWAKMYIQAGVKPKLLYKHNEEWEKSIESHFLPLVTEHTYLPINSNNWLANKRLLSQLKATVGPLPLVKSISFGGRKRGSKKNEVARTLFHQENHLTRQTLPISSWECFWLFKNSDCSLCQSLTFFFLFCFLHFPTSPKVALLFTESPEQINYLYKFILSFSHFINIG